ncbi:methyltransferase-like protein 6 isoform X2 [Durio zibethinus]|uniref:tRNA N(3)-methylcytidine methyltransferase n=1 Tax=Durio zibethinus TaxID=66656 RepID=A0A6P5Z1K8_DURZI|nr:methyltransferase-like protein 6 isoform X2 [Durio zibethinus]
MSVSKAEASEYHSKDFNWETLRQEIENDPSLNYHLLPFNSPQPEEQHSNDSIKAWQNFHVQHSSGKFFKERRYLLKEFPELVSCADGSKVLEVGCGNGSTALPILRGNEKIILYACDCSNETLERAKEFIAASNVASVEHRLHPFYCDFATTGFPKFLACDYCREMFSCKDQNCLSDVGEKRTHETDSLSMEERSCCVGGVDFVTLIFTLSAVPLQTMPTAIRECFSVLKPGGLLLFRDYGLYDMTMLRFESDQRVGFREYMRSDGTRSYFFCLDTARNLFISAGFIESVNRRNGESMRRVWVHGKFQKP